MRRIDIHRAAERGDVVVLERYLDAGGDVERRDSVYQAAPVHWASLRGKLTVVLMLLDRGAALEARTGADGTPLVWGCMGGDPDVVRHLLQRGANISAITKGKSTALHHAATYGHVEAVKILLGSGAVPQAEDMQGRRPGDSFENDVAQGVRRAIALTLAKARGETTAGKTRFPVKPLASSTHSPRAPTETKSSFSRRPNSDDDSGGAKVNHSKNAGGQGNVLGNNHLHSETSHGGGSPRHSSPGFAGKSPGTEPTAARSAANSCSISAMPQPSPRGDTDRSSPRRVPGAASFASSKSMAIDISNAKKPEPYLSGHTTLEARPSGRDSVRYSQLPPRSGGTDRRSAKGIFQQTASSHSVGGATSVVSSNGRRASCPPGFEANSVRAEFAEANARPPSPSAQGAIAARLQTKRLAQDDAQAELADLRRGLAALESAMASTAKRESEERSALREALKDAAVRAEEAGRAEQRRSEKLAATVHALENRISEGDVQRVRLKEELDGKDAQLQRAEHELAELRSRVYELENGMTALSARVDGFSAARAINQTAPTVIRAVGISRIPKPAQHKAVQTERIGDGSTRRANGGSSSRKSQCLGFNTEKGVRSIGIGGMGNGVANASVGMGAGSSQAEFSVEWWERGGSWDAGHLSTTPSTVNKSDSAELHERLNSLYSMIARR